MATIAEPQAPSGMPRGDHRADVPSSRAARWWSSWRIALRMARRDLRRHRGRAVLVFLMVAIPVGLLAGAATLGATEQTEAADLTTARMGSGQALVQGPSDGEVFQAPDPNSGGMGSSEDNPAAPIPGYAADASRGDNARAVGALVGGTAVPVADTEMRFVNGDRRIRVSALVIDPRIADVGDKARLTGGSWGGTADEVVVTRAGETKGIPASGTVTLSAGGTERTVTVVGTASALSEWGGQPDLVLPALPHGAPTNLGFSTGWIITGEDAVTWDEVRTLNTYGLTVFSREVLEHPPAQSELPPELRAQSDFTQDTARMIAVLGGVMLFIITTLLVGPAFAVSASRQRRTLALAATNGAEVRQLRRTVLAQALVLGVISAVGGVALGILAVRVGLWWWVRTHPSTSFASVPLDVPWSAIGIILPCAVLSAVIAALLPSLRLGRLDIIGVLRGQSVSPRLGRVLPVVGLGLAAVGGFVVLSAARMQVGMAGGEVKVAIGAIALVLGTLLVIPALLVLFGRLAAHLPAAPRIAIRDAARHRSRSTPTVAAILAGVAALTAFSIGLASDTEQQMAEYVPQALPGEGLVYTGDAEAQLSVAAALKAVSDRVATTPYLIARGADDPLGMPPSSGAAPHVPFVAAVLPDCTVQQAIVQSGPDGRCVQIGTMAYNNGFIGVLPADAIGARLDLTDAQRQAIERGGIAVAVPQVASMPTVSLASGTFVMDQTTYSASEVRTTRTDQLPVVAVPASRRASGAMPGQVGAFVTPQTAQRLGWPTTQSMVLMHAPEGGPIDEATEQQLDERIGEEGGLYVERGFQRYDETVMRVMMGAAAALLLIVTLISTALSMAEQQADSGTLAAVGATRRTRRGFAASQAMVVGLLGALLGLAVGLVPGIAITYPLTSQGSFDPATGAERMAGSYLAIPWAPLLLVVVGVPVVAGLLSAAAIRKAPALTRRAD